MEKIIQNIADIINSNFKVSKVILFGSAANGTGDENSDIDLLVVLDEPGISKSYEEKLERQLKISKHLINFQKKIPIDLIVYTKDEWEILLSSGSSFLNN